MVHGRKVGLALVVAVASTAGAVMADPIGGVASQACYKHYLGSTDSDAFYHVPVRMREHILDCIELYDRTGRLPSEASVSRLTSQYDAEEEADSRAYEAELTREVGHKPTTADYIAAMAKSMCVSAGAKGAGCPQAASGAAFAIQDSQQIRQAVFDAHQTLRGQLKDPDSAQFDPHDGSGYSFNSDGSLYAICGAVNARNGFGGYVGQQAWVYVIPKNIVYTQESGLTKAMVFHDCTGRVHAQNR